MDALMDRARMGTIATVGGAQCAIDLQERWLQGHTHGRFCYRWRWCRKVEEELRALRELHERAEKGLAALEANDLRGFLEYFDWFIRYGCQMANGRIHPVLARGNVDLLFDLNDRLPPDQRLQLA